MWCTNAEGTGGPRPSGQHSWQSGRSRLICLLMRIHGRPPLAAWSCFGVIGCATSVPPRIRISIGEDAVDAADRTDIYAVFDRVSNELVEHREPFLRRLER